MVQSVSAEFDKTGICEGKAMNINQELYNMIFKRKSFHLFRNIGSNSISVSDIESIVATYGDFVPL